MRTHNAPVSPKNRPKDLRPPRSARAFWQRFIDRVSFDVRDQPLPIHGGRNWVKIPMPGEGQWITGYGYQNRLGLYLSYDWDLNPGLYDALLNEQEALRRKSGVMLEFERKKMWIGINRSRDELGDEDAQIEWLCNTANGLVTALRPRLNQLAR